MTTPSQPSGPTTAATTAERAARHGLTVRARITAGVAFLVLVALSGAGVIVYAIESNNVDQAAINEIEQEFDELDAYLERYPAPPPGQQPDPLKPRLEGFLRNNVPDDQEILVGWVNDGAELRIAGDDVESVSRSMSEDPDFLAAARRVIGGRSALERIDVPPYGEAAVAAQTVRQGDDEGAL